MRPHTISPLCEARRPLPLDLTIPPPPRARRSGIGTATTWEGDRSSDRTPTGPERADAARHVAPTH